MKSLALVLMAAVAVAAVTPALAQGVVDPQEEARRFPKVPTDTTLFFHINGFQEFPINTQAPDDRYQSGDAYGLIGTSTNCIDHLTGGALGPNGELLDQDMHTIYGYVSPSYVQYDKDEGGKPRIHQERGISYDVEIVGEQFFLHWYVQTHAISGNPAVPVNNAPVVVPNVIVMGTMRAGDAISVGNEAYNEGKLIAQGYAGPYTLAGASTSQLNATPDASQTFPRQGSVAYRDVDGAQVYEFIVPMTVEDGIIPRADGANLRIDVFVENPACQDPSQGYVMPNEVRIHSSVSARPRIEMVINNPIMVPYLHPQFVAGDMVVHAQANSPWGNYDVDEKPGGIEVSIANQDNPAITARTIQRASFVQHALDHNKHQEAVDVTYLWDFKSEAAPDGIYEVVFTVWNDAHSASAEGRSVFQIGKGGTDTLPECDPDIPVEEQANCIQASEAGVKKDSPGAGVLAFVLVAALAAVLRRRSA